MQQHTNIKLRFAASRACVAALFKIWVGATLGSGLRAAGLRRAMRCMGLTHFRAGAMHCAGLTHATFLKLQGAVTYTYYFKSAVRLHLKHWSKYSFSAFFVLKAKKHKKVKNLVPKNGFFKFAPKCWSRVLFPKKQIFSCFHWWIYTFNINIK